MWQYVDYLSFTETTVIQELNHHDFIQDLVVDLVSSVKSKTFYFNQFLQLS